MTLDKKAEHISQVAKRIVDLLSDDEKKIYVKNYPSKWLAALRIIGTRMTNTDLVIIDDIPITADSIMSQIKLLIKKP